MRVLEDLYDVALVGSQVYNYGGICHDEDYFCVIRREDVSFQGLKVHRKYQDGMIVYISSNGRIPTHWCIVNLDLLEEALERPENVCVQTRNIVRSRILYGRPSFETSPVYKELKKKLNLNDLKTLKLLFQQYMEDQGFMNLEDFLHLSSLEKAKRLLRLSYTIKTWNLPDPLLEKVNRLYHELKDLRHKQEVDAVTPQDIELIRCWHRLRKICVNHLELDGFSRI
jgi:hypothetical protein